MAQCVTLFQFGFVSNTFGSHHETEQDLLLSSYPFDEAATAEDYEQPLVEVMFHQKYYVKYSFNKFSYQQIT